MATPDQLIHDAQKRMGASVEHTKTEFNTVRTGRASAALLALGLRCWAGGPG